jgi:ATP-binding cassette subfamily B protein/subfamily B ATP-binding cassette protein MsbA
MSELRTPWARLPQPGEAVERERGWRPFRTWAFLRDLPRIRPYLRPYKGLTAVVFVVTGLSALLDLLGPWPLAIVIDTVLRNKPLPSLLGGLEGLSDTTLLVIAVVGGFLLSAAANSLTVVENYVTTKLQQLMTLEFRSELFQHAQRLSLSFHDRTLTGELMYNINTQASAAGQVTVAIPPLIQNFLTVGGMFYIAYRLDPTLALVALSVVPFIYYSASFYMRRIHPQVRYVRGLEKQSLSILQEALAMLRVIIAFGRERYEYRRFREQAETAIDARLKITLRQTFFSVWVDMMTAAGTAVVLFLGARAVMAGTLTAGELIVILGYIASIYKPLQAISGSLATMQNQFVQLQGALEMLDTEPEVKEAHDAVVIDRAGGEIRFENVSFSYAEGTPALKDISLTAAPGQRVAIVGPTGAGKSTLVSLLPRFYDPQRGRIVLGGRDIRTLTIASLRDQISIVLQEPLLFAGSIVDNIAYGRLDAGEQDIVEAAKAANAHDFIVRLPQGYETVIGQRGTRLSGGERQRISVARAFLKDAPILILDEPTSSVDSRTEGVILEALERLIVGRTTFMIAHRLSTVRHADLVLVVLDGEIVERGTQEELLARGGVFHDLWRVQAGRQAHRRRSVSFLRRS